ncbi:Hypothetical_protein [Hexamita inflata]|uniref:Hypothetical_protein n=1 Tax=Hexamita inflata TaxID=28002 RepID=A0AA86PRK0_9EUKA|nr:Hypothetical protein HINF_LOCUS29783 [Hexamita inflata]
MIEFKLISDTQLEDCQVQIIPGNAFSLRPIVTQFCYIQIDDIEANQSEPNKQVCETKVGIQDQQGENLVYYGQYYILKRGVQYAIQRIHYQDTKQIQLHFEHKVTGIWTPDFDHIQNLPKYASKYNLNRFKDNTIQIQRMGETKLTFENKYQILDSMHKRKEEYIKYTEPRIKQSPVKIYIKVISSEQYKYPVNNINHYVKVKIVSNEKNKLQYGDYYELQLNQEYCLFTTLEPQEEFSLVFNEKVSFEWIPDFPIVPEPSSGIQIMRRGEYLPQNKYFFDNVKCCKLVSVIAQNTIRLIKEPLQNQDYNKLEFKPLTYIKRHEPLVITQLYGDLGFTTYKGLEGWVCLRYLSKYGKESACDCEKCLPLQYKGQPFELYQPKQPLLKSQIINDQIQRQIFWQYAQCQCAHCNEVKQKVEPCIDPETELIKQFYQKFARCIDYDQITSNLNQMFQENYESKQIQQLFLERILPKKGKQIPDDIMAEFHRFSACIYKDQQQITKNIILDEMSVQMKDYNTAKIKESLKNWFSYQSKIKYIPKSQKLSDEEIQAEIHRIVNKCAEKQLHHNVVYNAPQQFNQQYQIICDILCSALNDNFDDNTNLEFNQFPQCINQYNSIQGVDMQVYTENYHQEQSSRDTNCSNNSGTTQHQETLSTDQNIQSENSQLSFNFEYPSFLNKYK